MPTGLQTHPTGRLLPRLRGDLCSKPIEHQGRPAILLGDPARLMTYVITPGQQAALQCFDGVRTWESLIAELSRSRRWKRGGELESWLENLADWARRSRLLDEAPVSGVPSTLTGWIEPQSFIPVLDDGRGVSVREGISTSARWRVVRQHFRALFFGASLGLLALVAVAANFAGEGADATQIFTADFGAGGTGTPVIAEGPGILVDTFVRHGDHVSPGALLARLDNAQYREERRLLEVEMARAKERRDVAYHAGNQRAYDEEIALLAKMAHRMGDLRYLMASLEIRANREGTVSAPQIGERMGTFFDRGDVVMRLSEPVKEEKPLLAGALSKTPEVPGQARLQERGTTQMFR